MRLLLTVYLLLATWCPAEVPPFQSVTLQWDVPPATNQVILYRVYASPAPFLSTNLMGTTASNRFTLTNILAVPQRWFVASSNIWGEGDPCPAYLAPTAPVPPSNLRPVSTSLAVPLPGIVEGSTDLAAWTSRLRLTLPENNTLTLTHTLLPTEPLMFWRSKPFAAGQVPPLP